MFIARQAIFNRALKVYGYELLFRRGEDSIQFDGISSAQATASVIGGLFESGISQIVENKRAFVNFDSESIYSDAMELIDVNSLVIEVLEDVKVDECLINRIMELKKKGYKIALDDFAESYSAYPLIKLADIIKYDLRLTPLEDIKDDVKKALSQNKILLAEKIEYQEEFLKAKEMGFHLFQGYFFSKPDIAGKSINHTTTKSQYSRLLLELMKEEPSYQVLAEIIEKDANLAYRLVQLVSKRSGTEIIYSIKRALTFMGLKELERWINILMLREIGDTKPDELMRISLIRTKFSELVAIHGGLGKIRHEAALMGLFSTLDAMLNQTMSEALKNIRLPQTIIDALIYHRGVLMPIYQVILSYEQGDWYQALYYADILKINDSILYEDYINAVEWCHNIMSILKQPFLMN